jgi:5-methylcytosine-specific restriction endonuclease McrBC GTP-binding regulatory subunit McrB
LVKHVNGDRTYTVSADRQSRLNDAIDDLHEMGNIYTDFNKVIGGSNASLQWAVLNAMREYGNTLKDTNRVNHPEDLDVQGRRIAVRSLKAEDYRWPAAAPYVLIVDEINRGNIAAILGELITLLEPAKRLGKEEALTLTLPYSRDRFGVPANLHLIGTMNTADRSVETLDAALRRRFSFVSVPPDTEVLHQVLKDDVIIEVEDLSVNLADLLDLLNARIIALRDADHAIGHSYFLNVRGWRSLRDVFCDRLIPLLREYFFGNPGQLQLILGRGFCHHAGTSEVSFAPTDADNNASGTNFTVYSFPRPVDASALALCLRQLGLT